MNLFQSGYKELFPHEILSDSQHGEKTLSNYEEIVLSGLQQLNSYGSDEYVTGLSIQNSVYQKCAVLDKLEDAFVLNSSNTLLFQSEEQAREMVRIVVLDAKKVIIDNAIRVLEAKSNHANSKNGNELCLEKETQIFSPTSSTKKKRPNLPIQAKDILSNWFRDHVDHPYPTQAEKMDLSEQTGLSLQKVDNWFINERSRKWQNYKQK